MLIKRILQIFMIVGVLPLMAAGQDSKLASVKTLQCTFPLIANGTWKNGKAEAVVKPATLTMKFVSINTDEGSAQLDGGSGTYDIIVRYASGYLNFIQSFRDGPMYTTTVFQKETTGGKLKAVHSRHELFDFPLPGFTSSPEQYYGECEIKE
ncbi:MAG TPA: hypothetical protein VLL56_02140 [Terriglobia bacterium]|jgi:hypothetical protein|nr:hypothetical protein [Terriglobia bacterium]